MRAFIPHFIFGLVLVVFFIVSGSLQNASAQDQVLLDKFRQAHFQQKAANIASRTNGRIEPLPASFHYSDSIDSLRVLVGLHPLKPVVEEESQRFQLTDVESFSRLQRPAFESRFGDVRWTYIGVEGLTGSDTRETREIRAHLQSAFGNPTQTISDKAESSGGIGPDNNIQFEYWLAVNDTIPVQIIDPFGPFDRGIVLASDWQYRDVLIDLREQLVSSLVAETPREPYVDYFYEADGEQWYRAGFDGEAFFETPIRRPTLRSGRRPVQ